MQKTLYILPVAIAALAYSACGKLDEGVNAHNLTGTVVVPKSVVGTNELGMIVVGVYSGLDLRVGYPSPVAAPAGSAAGADTFPYGGTSIGTFANRDYRYVCQNVSARDVRDAGTNYELDFEILQFPFYEGAVVWAFLDQFPYGSCNPARGYSDYKQILIDLLTVTEGSAGQFVVTVDQSTLVPDETGPAGGPLIFTRFTDSYNLTRPNAEPWDEGIHDGDNDHTGPCAENEPIDPEDPIYCKSTELIDEGGQYWEVEAIDDPARTIILTPPIGGGGTPIVEGGSGQARLYLRWDDPLAGDLGLAFVDYGSQYNDLLNFPSLSLGAEDFVSNQSNSPVLTDLSPVTVTIDTPVAP